jgi:predicted nucleic acid-binding protein
MRFWDSSAVVPLLIDESATLPLQVRYRDDPLIVAWWGTPVECMSALVRLEREARLDADAMKEAVTRLKLLQRRWQEVQPLEVVREMALRLLRVHPLRAADAVQLAAAIVASEGRPATLEFVCLDARLAAAAQKEGFEP